MYKRCMYKKGWRSFLPIGAFKNSQLKKTATSLYTQLYANFAKSVLYLKHL
jgi:protein MBA1